MRVWECGMGRCVGGVVSTLPCPWCSKEMKGEGREAGWVGCLDEMIRRSSSLL